jgi:hypothetical protein
LGVKEALGGTEVDEGEDDGKAGKVDRLFVLGTLLERLRRLKDVLLSYKKL